MRPALHQLARAAKSVLVFGIGGGGDVIQTLAIRNYLRHLGVARVYIGGVTCQWWPPDDEPAANAPFPLATSVWGPRYYGLDEVVGGRRLGAHALLVSEAVKVGSRTPPESDLAALFATEAVLLDVTGGGAGMRAGLTAAVTALGIDLVVGMDVGSDSFFSNTTEVRQPRTPLSDFISLAGLAHCPVPAVYGLAGYGCDEELAMEDLERNVGAVMRAGGFLGAYGLTQEDVADIDRACAVMPDPVEKWPAEAAKGNLGVHRMRLMEPWGSLVRITPLQAMILFFDPVVLTNTITRLALALADTDSLAAAETVLAAAGVLPESYLARTLHFLRPDLYATGRQLPLAHGSGEGGGG